ncbi:MAG: hypothetical protein ACRERV_16050 [Methylococcales bacterium]
MTWIRVSNPPKGASVPRWTWRFLISKMFQLTNKTVVPAGRLPESADYMDVLRLAASLASGYRQSACRYDDLAEGSC